MPATALNVETESDKCFGIQLTKEKKLRKRKTERWKYAKERPVSHYTKARMRH